MKTQTVPRIIQIWLFASFLLIVTIMMLRGIGSMMEGGMSITEWKPVSSIVYTAPDDVFAQEFQAYRNLPQFQRFFPHMEIQQFRTVYKIEYCRYIARNILIAVVVIPFLLFLLMRMLSVPDTIKLLLIFGTGAAQYRVHSYLVEHRLIDDPHFAPYRLSLVLAMQFFFLGLVLWQLLTFSYPKQGSGGLELPKPGMALKIFSCVALATIFVQTVLGGAVTGLHAGLIFNTFPLMDMSWVPDGLWPLPEWYKNLFEDVTTVQFVHRVLAYGLTAIILLFWLSGRNNPHIAHLLPILFSVFVVQFLLGVLTLLFTVPIPISSLHYANAILTFCISLTIVHRLFVPLRTIYYDIGVADHSPPASS